MPTPEPLHPAAPERALSPLPFVVPLPLRERMRETAFRFIPGRGAAIELPEAFGRLGALEVRLAASAREVKRAQRLRYKVFYREMSAVPAGMAALKRRDIDEYDAICDHLLVLDHAVRPKPFRAFKPKVVGTYRLLRQEVAEANFGFYTAGEFDIGPLLDAHRDKTLLELGRSCVLKPYRNKKTVELLWAGLWSYVQRHRIDAMIGCASLDGTDPDRLAPQLSFLHHYAAAEPEWCASALPRRYVAMNRIPAEALDRKAALLSLPPLVKAYLRVGAKFGDGAVIDRQFGTTDVFVVMPVRSISDRYLNYFGPTANRYAA
jgi:L-ornithine Nalpha-acyltransferase